MMRALLLCALAAVASAAPALTTLNNEKFHTLRPELGRTPCAYCKELVSTLEAFVADPQTQASIAKFVQSNVCVGLPPSFADICTQEVPVLVAQAALQLQTALEPRDVCAMAGVCHGASLAQLLGVPQDKASPWDCPVCKMVVVAFVQRLQDPQQRQQLEDTMRAACAALDEPQAQERCMHDVTNLFTALDELLHDVNPAGLCHFVDYCSPHLGEGVSAVPAVPASARALGAALRQLATGAPAAANADMCQNCKTIVLEAAAILQDPKTQAELLEYAREGCSIFQDFKDQCEQYVTLYGPLVFNMLISYLQPEALCTRLGYCSQLGHLAVV